MMPIMMLFWFNSYASGLSYYYFVSLLITMGQTWAIRKTINDEEIVITSYSIHYTKLYESLWTNDDFVYLTTQTEELSLFTKGENGEVVEKTPGAWEQLLWFWKETNDHWNYSEGQELIVEVISGCPEVESYNFV